MTSDEPRRRKVCDIGACHQTYGGNERRTRISRLSEPEARGPTLRRGRDANRDDDLIPSQARRPVPVLNVVFIDRDSSLRAQMERDTNPFRVP